MEIILEAFGGKLSSDVMLLPERTGSTLQFALPHPLRGSWFNYETNDVSNQTYSLVTFEYRGKRYQRVGVPDILVYELVDIDKRH